MSKSFSLSVALFVVFVATGLASAQTVPSADASDPQALAVLNKAVSAFAPNTIVSSLQLKGQVISHIPPAPQNAQVTITVNLMGESTFAIDQSGNSRTESTPALSTSSGCRKTGADGALHDVTLHNCMLSLNRFLPLLTVSAQLNRNVALLVPSDNPSQSKVRISKVVNSSDSDTRDLLKRLSAATLTFDAQTNLPLSLSYFEHPDKDAKTNVPAVIEYSDYRLVSGVMVPFKIKKYLNYALLLDISVDSVLVNPKSN